MNILSRTIASSFLLGTTICLGATPTLSEKAQALAPVYDTYRAGNYTITIGGNHPATGYTYRGCDTQQRCIDLQYGTSWYDGHRRGITWENGDHYYAVSWQDGARWDSMVLVVYQGDRVLLQESMVPVLES
ncbi:MAG: hypothetical protein F6J87_16125 [Spirulina sp. SIO3F2]|nr:hypothetical protein [Spirulina sp. SIO3F2]